ncbi:MAG: phosphopyruvate hydratase [Planctomycetaceae bacterium]|nr:phosphopyruvate hydratase [Planctomycetaceae bacterium]
MTRIEQIHAREVFDSRGRPTVEVEIRCAGGRTARAIVPSGASTGEHESVELRDEGEARLDGSGVTRAVSHVRGEIAQALQGADAADQQQIDRVLCELDGTPNKSRLGANAILGVSLAAACAAAEAKNIRLIDHLRDLWRQVPSSTATAAADSAAGQSPTVSHVTPHESFSPLGTGFSLPLPMVNMISGGLHAGGNLDFQDFLILPVGASSYRQALDWIITVYRRLGTLLEQTRRGGRLVGDEGGYGPILESNGAAVEFVVAAIEAAGLAPGDDVAIGLDVASSHFYRDGKYVLSAGAGTELTSEELVGLLESWVDRWPVISIEDGLAENDWDGWKLLTERLSDRVQLIGDDLFVTSRHRLQRGIDSGTANSVLIKLNQIGSLWETLETLRLALDNGYWPVVSARSGETEDSFIADLVVATGAGQIKVGSITRSERLAKYNQLLRLDEQLGDDAAWYGGSLFGRIRRSASTWKEAGE